MKYLGLISSAASGKLGGVVASHNRGGQYFRKHSIPTQPRTSAVRVQRNALAAFSSAFRNLGATNISGWNALAATVTLKSKLGTTYHPTGQQLYVSCAKHLTEIGITSIPSTAPTIPTFPAIGTFTMASHSADTTVSTMTYTVSPSWSDNYGVVVRASSVQSTGRTFIGKSAYRTLAGYSSGGDVPADFFTIYTDKFGPLPQAGNISFMVKLIDPSSGFAGAAVSSALTFSQPVGTNLYSITAANKTLSLATGTVTLTPVLTDNDSFTGAISWSLLNLPAGATYSCSANPDASAPTITISKGSLTTSSEGAYSCSVVGAYGTFTATATFTLTVAA